MHRHPCTFSGLFRAALLVFACAQMVNCGGGKTDGDPASTAIAPTITTQPAATRNVAVGESVSFTVVASGTPTPTYQWKKGGVTISGTPSATLATYTIASPIPADSGIYTVTVTNAAGHVDSNPVTLTVTPGTQDSQGWTIFLPSADSRIMYVSTSGNDATGQVYSSAQVGTPLNPGTVNAYETFAAAYAQSRDGYPDWILLKRGDTFSANLTMKSGRGLTEYALIGAYGASGAMPIVNPLDVTKYAVSIPSITEYSAVTGIDCYAVRRDPAIPGYSVVGNSGFDGTTNRSIRYILIEGCRFRFFTENIIQSYSGGLVEHIVIRRNVISNSYSDGNGHSQGLFSADVNDLLLEENVFDHNGWYSQAPGTPGTATMFSHNTYLAACHNVVFSRNIFTRSSSIGNKFTANNGVASSTNITLNSNLYLDNEIGISIGGNTEGPYRFKNINIEGNIFTEMGRSQPTARTLGWALELKDWDGGNVKGNYFLKFSNPMVTNTYGINIVGGVRDVKIESNISYNLNPHGNSSSTPAFSLEKRIDPASPKSNILVVNNLFQEPVNQLRIIKVEDSADLAAFRFQNNRYFTPNESTAIYVVSANTSFAAWTLLTGDTSLFSRSVFPEPTRSIETYMQHIGATATIDAFINGCRNQGRYNWDTKYTAEVINSWIKAGF